MKYIFDINTVQPGMKLYENVVWKNITLISAGTILTKDHIDRLRNREIYEVAINLSEFEKQKYQFDYNVIPTVRTSITKGATNALKGIDGIKPLNEKSIVDIKEYAKKIVDSIQSSPNFTYKLSDYSASDVLDEHAVRTATYAVAVANAYNNALNGLTNLEELKKRTISLESIAIAALLHDVGKLCKNSQIRHGIKDYVYLGTKFPGLTKEKYFDLNDNYDPEFNSYYGYNIIHDCKELPTDVQAMVLFSGETNIDGPLQMHKSINFKKTNAGHITAAKIINICSHFDEYMMENIKKEVTLENAFNKFQTLFTSGKFDDSLKKLVIETIPLYPIGTKLLLEGNINGYAIVYKTFTTENNYHTPILLTIPDKKEVDLSKTTNTTVKQVVGDKVKMFNLLFDSSELEKVEEYKKAI